MAKQYTVFTYGSLMKGFYGYKNFMQKATFLGKATVDGDLRFFCSDYPVMINKSKGGMPVKGELYSVDEDTMNELRKYEGLGNPFTCYTERVVKACTEEGCVIARAFVVIPTIELPILFTTRHIPEGDWRKFKSSKKRLPIPKPLVLALSASIVCVATYEIGHYMGLL